MPLGDVARNPDTGDTYRLDKVGNDLKWVELGDDEATMVQLVAEQGPVAAFAGGAVRSATFGLGGPEEAQAAAQETQFPVASTLGSFAPDIALGVGGLSKGVAARIAQRGAAQVAKQTAARAPAKLIRRPSNILGRSTTAGSAARIGEGVLEAIPGLNLPLLAQKAINAKRTNRAFAQAMGLSDDAIERSARSVDDVTGDVLEMFKSGYDDITEEVGKHMDVADATAIFEGAQESGYISRKLAAVIKKQGVDSKELMSIRSELAKLNRSNADFLVKKDAEQYIQAIDEIVARALERSDDAVSIEAFKTLNSRYSVWANMRKGRGIGADGMINPRTLDGRFLNSFGDKYRAGKPITSDQAVNDFLATIREGAGLDVGLPSSGTSERAIGAAALAAGAGVLGGS